MGYNPWEYNPLIRSPLILTLLGTSKEGSPPPNFGSPRSIDGGFVMFYQVPLVVGEQAWSNDPRSKHRGWRPFIHEDILYLSCPEFLKRSVSDPRFVHSVWTSLLPLSSTYLCLDAAVSPYIGCPKAQSMAYIKLHAPVCHQKKINIL